MRDILVFGAAFDPPHLGHEQVIVEVLKKGIAREVWLVPCKQHAFAKKMSASTGRYVMCQSLVRDGVVLSDLELKREGVSYAYDTLREVRERNPGKTVGWLMGSDLVGSFDKWYKAEGILQEFGVWVYPREGSEKIELSGGMNWIKGVTKVVISSTEIRRLVKSGGVWKNMVNPRVTQYIGEHGLYAKAD